MSVVYVPPRGHWCGPNEYGFWIDTWDDPVGTVRQCEQCGKSWVAWKDRRDIGYMGVKWRREGWLARRRRMRRAA